MGAEKAKLEQRDCSYEEVSGKTPSDCPDYGKPEYPNAKYCIWYDYRESKCLNHKRFKPYKEG